MLSSSSSTFSILYQSLRMTTISKRKGLFQDSYALEYALRITERHVHTRQILSARCLFCVYVGRRKQAPSMTWWIITAVVNTLTKYVNKVFVQLQSDNLLVCQQKTILEKLAVDICAYTVSRGPIPITELAENCNSTHGRFSITHESVVNVIYDQGLFIRDTCDNLDDAEQMRIIRAVGKFHPVNCQRDHCHSRRKTLRELSYG